MKNIFLIFIPILIFFGCDRENAYQKGTKYFNQKNYEKALPHFHVLLKDDPESDLVNKKLGICYYHLNKLREATFFINRSLKYQPEQPELRYLYAKILIKRGSYSKGIKVLYKLVEDEPNNIEKRVDLATAYLLFRNINDGMKHFNIVFKKVDNKEILKYKKDIAKIFKKYPIDYGCDKKIEIFKDIADSEKNIENYYNYYNILQCKKDFKKDEDILLKILKMEPSVKYYKILANLYLKNGKLDKGEDAIFKAEELDFDGSDTGALRGYLNYRRGKFSRALNLFEKHIEKNKDFNQYNIEIAECYKMKDDYKKAIHYIKKELLKNENNLYALGRLSELYGLTDQIDKKNKIDLKIKWFHKKGGQIK